MHAAGGLGTTARDLARWLRLNLNSGRIDDKQVLPAAGVAEMHKPQSQSTRKHPHPDLKIEGFGLGWQVGTYAWYPKVAVTRVQLRSSQCCRSKIGVAVLANSDGAAGGLVEVAALDVFDRLLAEKGTDLMPKLHEMADRIAKAAVASRP